MKLSVKACLLILFAVLSFSSFAQKGMPPSNPKDLKDGAKCPNAVLKDSLMQDVSIKSFHGKYVFIDVWHSRCSPCYAQIPALKALEKEMKGENIVFLSINMDTEEYRWKGMRKMYPGIPLWDNKGPFSKAFNVIYTPRCILIDPKGKIIKAFMPQPSKPEALKFLKKLFNKE